MASVYVSRVPRSRRCTVMEKQLDIREYKPNDSGRCSHASTVRRNVRHVYGYTGNP